jgi:hypothetical protein
MLLAGAITLSLWGGLLPGKETLVCGPYERGGFIYRIGSTGSPIEKCMWMP